MAPYMELRVARLPALPDMGMLWGRAATRTSAGSPTPSQRAQAVAAPENANNKATSAAEGHLLEEGELVEELDLVRPGSRWGSPVQELSAADQVGAWTDMAESAGGEQGWPEGSVATAVNPCLDLDI